MLLKKIKVAFTIFFVLNDCVGTETLNPCHSMEGDHLKKRRFFMDKTFKERIRIKLIKGAAEYSKLTNSLYVFESKDFKSREIYILRFDVSNYKHLTGVSSELPAKAFYCKCLQGTLTLDDFDCEMSKERKGFIRRKMSHIGELCEALEGNVDVEERYQRGRVVALFAFSDGKFTLAFTGGSSLNPMSLLDGRTLHKEKEIKGLKARKYKI